jgi:triosephosphate isomerase
MRTKLVAGNWKMHTTRAEARLLAGEIVAGLRRKPAIEVAVFPPYTALAAVRDLVEPTPIGLGAQNVWHESQGAFTGEISPAQLLDAGCDSVLVGHSERRHVVGETGTLLAKKAAAALAAGLRVIYCVGETLDERDAGRTWDVVRGQLEELAGQALAPDRIVIAYEPVWAIGTGRNATPDQAQEVHAMIRQFCGERYNGVFGASVRILYGGSVKPDNAAALMSQSDVDGALVGGASLNAGDFLKIIEAAETVSGG